MPLLSACMNELASLTGATAPEIQLIFGIAWFGWFVGLGMAMLFCIVVEDVGEDGAVVEDMRRMN